VRSLGIGIMMLAGTSTVALITTQAPAAAKGTVHTVSADAYVTETSPGSTSISLNSTSRVTILRSPPLPAGNYFASANALGFIATSTDTNDYTSCFIDKSPFPGTEHVHAAWGWNGVFSLHPEEVFLHVASGTRLALYCFSNEPSADADIGSAVLEVTRYGTISLTQS
jgi:hypothetical protein